MIDVFVVWLWYVALVIIVLTVWLWLVIDVVDDSCFSSVGCGM